MSRSPRSRRPSAGFALAALFLGGCSSAYYATMEKFGVHKREILVDRVTEGREDQEAAKEQFLTTFERFQALTGFDGGDLEDRYESLVDEYEAAESRAEAVSDQIESIEDVAAAMFEEWSGEIDAMHDEGLAGKSREMMEDTEDRYEVLIAAMKQAEAKMQPVLHAFEDQVTFLKHHLNAQAIASLEDTAVEIETDVGALIDEMEAAIRAADAFLESMEGSS